MVNKLLVLNIKFCRLRVLGYSDKRCCLRLDFEFESWEVEFKIFYEVRRL